MIKYEMARQFLVAQKDVEEAKKALKKATDNLSKIEKLIEEQISPKPKMVHKSSRTFEIEKYKKYSDKYIEFELMDGNRGRYVALGTSKSYTYPNSKATDTLESLTGHAFEMYDLIANKYAAVDYIDHIELLEGVDEYDKTREL